MSKREMDILAAEYTLGTLDAADRIKAENLRESDRTFAHQVQYWEQRLTLLSEAEDKLAPPASLWRRIEAALPAIDGPLAGLADQIAEMKRSLAVWRFATVGAVAAAVAMALVWVGGLQSPLTPVAPAERYVAMLQSKAGETGFVVTVDMKQHQFAIRPLVAKAPPSMSYELWCIMRGKNSPAVTVGLVGTDAYAMMDVPSVLSREDLEKGVELAISLEPEGGAPSGNSMGPIMFAGLLIKQTP